MKPTRYRRIPGEMTKTEARFYAILALQLQEGKIIRIDYEAHTFRLANNLRYTPDFGVLFIQENGDNVAFYEVKGSAFFASSKSNQINSVNKCKVAASLYPEYMWYITHPEKDGIFKINKVDP